MPSKRDDRPELKGRKIWRGKYRDAEGKQHSRMFALKADAKAWEAAQTKAVRSNTWVDPADGKVLFKDFAEQWFARQIWRPSTEERRRSFFDNHLLPHFGPIQLADIRPQHVQMWVKGLTLGPGATRQSYGVLVSILSAATEERYVAINPCAKRVNLPKDEGSLIVPMKPEQVHVIHSVFPVRLKPLITLAAGTGMRQGECLGLTVDRVDFLRRQIVVDRQLVNYTNVGLDFGPTKTPSSNRVIPMADHVGEALAAHIAEFGVGEKGLLFCSEDGRALHRQRVGDLWRAALKHTDAVDVTFHDLRHYCASLLISAGVSVKGVQMMLGHKNAAETLNTYAHLWPSDDDRIRNALDSVALVVPKVVPKSS